MKNVFKVFILLIVCSLFMQCGPDYQTNKRVLIKGQLQNGNGEPLENIDVSAFTLTDDYFQGNQQNGYLLGRNRSQNDGTIEVVCLLDVDSDFYIRVNGVDDYVDYSYVFKTELSEPENLVVDMGNVVLQKIARVRVNFSNTSPMNNSLEYTVSYQNPLCYEFYEDSSLIAEESDCYQQTTRSNVVESDATTFTRIFYTTLGSSFNFTYSVNNGAEITETFNIDQLDYTYEFTY